MNISKSNMVIIAIIILLGLVALPYSIWAEKNQSEQNKEEPSKSDEAKMREQRRAFYTAPPVVPHEITSRGSRACLTCHKQVFEVGGRTTIQTPHPLMSNCLQCHVQGKLEPLPELKTMWQGLTKPGNKSRAHLFAPPTIPHRIALRENCLSCHGPKAKDVNLRTAHPERSNCMQCHVPNAKNEFKIESAAD